MEDIFFEANWPKLFTNIFGILCWTPNSKRYF